MQLNQRKLSSNSSSQNHSISFSAILPIRFGSNQDQRDRNSASSAERATKISSSVPHSVHNLSLQYIPISTSSNANKRAQQSSKVSNQNLSSLALIPQKLSLPAIIRPSSNQNKIDERRQVPYIKLFQARCQDLGLKHNYAQQERFFKQMIGNPFGQKLGGQNLKYVFDAIKQNSRVVSLKMQNNCITQEDQSLLKALIKDHPSLTALDFSNTDTQKQRNRLGNQGFKAIVDGILESQNSLISIIDVAQNLISSSNLIQELMMKKNSQIISLNLSDNEISQNFFEVCGAYIVNIQELKLSNTKQTNKSMIELSGLFSENRFQMQNLDLSRNLITNQGLFKLLNSLKNNQALKNLNLSYNDFSDDQQLKQFDNFLVQNKFLETLNLSFCKLEAQSAKNISKGLRKNQGLRSLILKGNPNLTDLGFLQLTEALFENNQHSLMELDVSKCGLQLTYLEDYAPNNSLQDQYLVSQNETKLILKKKEQEFKQIYSLFIEFVKTNKTLQLLNLRDNFVRDFQAQQILDSLKYNSRQIDSNNIKRARMKLLIEMNPCNYQLLKEFERINRENSIINRENQIPIIKDEINLLYEQHDRALEACNQTFDLHNNSHSFILDSYQEKQRSISPAILAIMDGQDHQKSQSSNSFITQHQPINIEQCNQKPTHSLKHLPPFPQQSRKSREQVTRSLPPAIMNRRHRYSLVETTEQMVNQIKEYQKAKNLNQQQFKDEDLNLESVKDEEHQKYKHLKKEKERLRQKRIDLDFEDEQWERRLLQKEKNLKKQVEDFKHKIEVVSLAQQKSQVENEQIKVKLKIKQEQHQFQKDAWMSEYEKVKREQDINVLIYENYQKEIERVKKRIEMQKQQQQKQENKSNEGSVEKKKKMPQNIIQDSSQTLGNGAEKRQKNQPNNKENNVNLINLVQVRPSKQVKVIKQQMKNKKNNKTGQQSQRQIENINQKTNHENKRNLDNQSFYMNQGKIKTQRVVSKQQSRVQTIENNRNSNQNLFSQHYRQVTQSAQRMLTGLVQNHQNSSEKLFSQQQIQNGQLIDHCSQDKLKHSQSSFIRSTIKKQIINQLSTQDKKAAKELQSSLEATANFPILELQSLNKQQESPSKKIKELKRLKRQLKQNFQDQDLAKQVKQTTLSNRLNFSTFDSFENIETSQTIQTIKNTQIPQSSSRIVLSTIAPCVNHTQQHSQLESFQSVASSNFSENSNLHYFNQQNTLNNNLAIFSDKGENDLIYNDLNVDKNVINQNLQRTLEENNNESIVYNQAGRGRRILKRPYMIIDDDDSQRASKRILNKSSL